MYRFLFRKFFWSRYGNRYLSLIAVFAITGFALGIAALLVVMSVMKGFQHQMKTKLRNISPDYVVSLSGASHTHTMREIGALLTSDQQLLEVIPIKGIVLQHAFGEAILDVRIVDDRYFLHLRPYLRPSTDRATSAIGAEVAKRLLLSPDSRITVAFPGLFADPLKIIPMQTEVTVGTILQTGVFAIDEYVLFLPRSQFQVDQIPQQWYREAYVFGHLSSQDIATISKFPGVLRMASWQEQNRLLYLALWLEQTTMQAFLWLIVFVALSSVVSLLYIFFSDRRQTLGVLLCLGLSPKHVTRVVTFFGSAIGVIGILLGLILASGILGYVYFSKHVWLPAIYYHRQFPIHIDPMFVCLVVGGSAILCGVVSFVIARKLLKTPVLEHLTDDPVV